MKVSNGVSLNNITSQVKNLLNDLVQDLSGEPKGKLAERATKILDKANSTDSSQDNARQVHAMFGKGTEVYQIV